jgi:hypothetical protein
MTASPWPELANSYPQAIRADLDAGDQPRMDDLVCIADVERQQVRWLWDRRIPLGKVAILDGDPGQGKSTLTLTIAAKVTTGSPFPDGTQPEVGTVIILSAEDDEADTIRPRLEAAGADLKRCFVAPSVHQADEPPRPPQLPGDLAWLELQIRAASASLVIIDPLMAYLDATVDSHRDQDVRRVMAGLKRVAESTGAAILVVRHLNKGQGAALYRGSGSIGIVGAARAGMLVADDPQDPGRHVLALTKSNLAAMPDGLAYRIVEDELYGVARVVWDGATTQTATDLLRPADPDEAPAQAEAEGILREIMTDVAEHGRISAKRVKQLAAQAGVSERTLDRARKALGVVSRREGFGAAAQYVWTMPAMDAQHPKPGEHGMHAMYASQTVLGTPGEHEDDDPGRFTR